MPAAPIAAATASVDAIVVGAGVVGASIAAELARTGANVVVVEQCADEVQGASGVNAGLICPSHSAPLATPGMLSDGLRLLLRRDAQFRLEPSRSLPSWLVRFGLACRPNRVAASSRILRSLSRRSLARAISLEGEGVELGVTRHGLLSIFETSRRLQAAQREARSHLGQGLRVEALVAAEAQALEPSLGGSMVGAIHGLDDAHCDPVRFVSGLRDYAEERGALFRRCSVTRLDVVRHRSPAIEVGGQRIRAGTVVLAAGVASRALARTCGLSLPIAPAKGYHVDLPGRPFELRRPVLLADRRVVLTPMADRIRVTGTFELGARDEAVRSRNIVRITRAARVHFPIPAAALASAWSGAGLRPCTPDGLPLLGRVSGYSGLILATGHGYLGVTLASVTGEAMSELIVGDRMADDVAACTHERFRV